MCAGCVVEFNNEGNGDESLLSGWADGAVRAHSIATGAILWEIPHAVRGAVTAIAQRRRFLIVAGSTSGSVRRACVSMALPTTHWQGRFVCWIG